MRLNLADKLHIFKPKMNYFKQKYQQMNSGLSIPKVAIKWLSSLYIIKQQRMFK